MQKRVYEELPVHIRAMSQDLRAMYMRRREYVCIFKHSPKSKLHFSLNGKPSWAFNHLCSAELGLLPELLNAGFLKAMG